MKVEVHPNKPQTKSLRKELSAHLNPQWKWLKLKLQMK